MIELEKTELEKTVILYQELLEKLIASHNSLSKQEVLEILLTRDAINNALSDRVKPSALVMLEIERLDSQLKENGDKLIQSVNLAEYRNNFPNLPDTWWWYLDIYIEEKVIESHPWNRFDGLIKVIRTMVWAGNLALLGNLASFFLNSASGLAGSVTIAIPGILSLLQAESELTEKGKQGFDKILKAVKIPQYFHEEAKLGSSLLMTGLLLGIYWNLPSISNYYKLEGKRLQEQQKLALAEVQYQQAINLDSNNLDAYYKLATLYEELQDFESAKKQYTVAITGGFLDAYNNLAYWYIRENKNEEAIELLRQGLQLIEEKERDFERLTNEEKFNFQSQKYNVYKNLGWARFQQERYDDAMTYLFPAMAIAKNTKYQQYIRSPGAAFCIYSQILSWTDGRSSEARENWQQCIELIESRLALGRTINSEEDEWLYKAREKLKSNQDTGQE